jgi:hypothetical protein
MELPDAKAFAQAWEYENRKVALTEVGAYRVSTVFLVIDHGWGSKVPLLFETMVFGGDTEFEMARYSTWEQAMQGHEAMVEQVRNAKG